MVGRLLARAFISAAQTERRNGARPDREARETRAAVATPMPAPADVSGATSDRLLFGHLPLSGDAELTVRVTGLASAGYVRERVRELHDQCRGLAISPPVTFGAVVVQLAFGLLVATERITVRVAVCRRLADRFRSGETVGVVGPSRLVVLMPAYGIEHAIEHVRSDLADLAAIDEVEVVVSRVSFSEDHATTFRSLAGASVGS